MAGLACRDVRAGDQAAIAERDPVGPGGLAVDDGVRRLVSVVDQIARPLRVDFFADDTNEGNAGADGRSRHRGERAGRVNAATTPEDLVVASIFDLDGDVSRYGVDVRGQQHGVVRWRANVPDRVDPDLAIVGLEEVHEAFGRLAFLAGRGRDRDEIDQQVSSLLERDVRRVARARVHDSVSSGAMTAPSASTS